MMVRVAGDDANVASAIRAAVRQVDPRTQISRRDVDARRRRCRERSVAISRARVRRVCGAGSGACRGGAWRGDRDDRRGPAARAGHPRGARRRSRQTATAGVAGRADAGVGRTVRGASGRARAGARRRSHPDQRAATRRRRVGHRRLCWPRSPAWPPAGCRRGGRPRRIRSRPCGGNRDQGAGFRESGFRESDSSCTLHFCTPALHPAPRHVAACTVSRPAELRAAAFRRYYARVPQRTRQKGLSHAERLPRHGPAGCSPGGRRRPDPHLRHRRVRADRRSPRVAHRATDKPHDSTEERAGRRDARGGDRRRARRRRARRHATWRSAGARVARAASGRYTLVIFDRQSEASHTADVWVDGALAAPHVVFSRGARLSLPALAVGEQVVGVAPPGGLKSHTAFLMSADGTHVVRQASGQVTRLTTQFPGDAIVLYGAVGVWRERQTACAQE